MKCLSCSGLLPWPHTETLRTHCESLGALTPTGEDVCFLSACQRLVGIHFRERGEEIQRQLNSPKQTVPQTQKGQDHSQTEVSQIPKAIVATSIPSFLTWRSTFRLVGGTDHVRMSLEPFRESGWWSEWGR